MLMPYLLIIEITGCCVFAFKLVIINLFGGDHKLFVIVRSVLQGFYKRKPAPGWIQIVEKRIISNPVGTNLIRGISCFAAY